MSLAALSRTPDTPDIKEQQNFVEGPLARYLDFFDESNALYARIFACREKSPGARDAISGALRHFSSEMSHSRGASAVMKGYWTGILKALNSDGQRMQSAFGTVFREMSSTDTPERT